MFLIHDLSGIRRSPFRCRSLEVSCPPTALCLSHQPPAPSPCVITIEWLSVSGCIDGTATTSNLVVDSSGNSEKSQNYKTLAT
ncbi:hypothetical protein Pfo_003649 [Paulownia fortunei]|nr:hypothetical protein Pfo_003649 [Paulownia fortunei]